MRFAYFVVEGQHDLAFLGWILHQRDLKQVDTKSSLDSFWLPLVPTAWPQKAEQGDLVRRVRVPTFFQSALWSVAVDVADGDSQLVKTVVRQLGVLNHPEQVEAIGVVLDADDGVKPEVRFEKVREGLSDGGFPKALAAGAVVAGPPRLGLFVLPDNLTTGTLEDLLLECAATNYPDLLASAQTHVDRVATANDLTTADLKDLRKPAGTRKAVVGAIGSILKPGKSIQVSIQHTRWIQGSALALPRIASFDAFVAALLV